jgi:LPS sulfotransferase NodH
LNIAARRRLVKENPDMLRKLFARPSTETGTAKDIIVVSGLPRSGTSMMMKMLAEGGVSIVTDEIRNADEDNPNGYFEYEPIKQLASGQNAWPSETNGKAVKIISALLEHLPPGSRYKIIFMEREIKEILASQKKMLARRNEKSDISDLEMEERFHKHLAAVKYWLARQPNIETLYVEYSRLVSSPAEYCQQIAEFIGVPVDVTKMRSVPDQHLYRNRAPNSI